MLKWQVFRTGEMIQPEQYQTLAEVRSAIDHVDDQIITLLGTRFRLIEAAARIKDDPHRVRDDVRNAQVLERMKTSAEVAGVPPTLAGELYAAVIEASIEHQLQRISGKRRNDTTD